MCKNGNGKINDVITIYKLTPSDLTFLYEGCKRCFVYKVKYGITQPSIPIPGMFSVIANLQKNYYSNVKTDTICNEIPSGVIKYGEKWVQSKAFDVPGSKNKFYIKGRFDIVAELEDNSYSIMDFKTATPTDETCDMYSKQLHSYALALENPESGNLSLSPITKLGLLYFTPHNLKQVDKSHFGIHGDIKWIEIERNNDKFQHFLHGIVHLLEGPLPKASSNCNWCSYLSKYNLLMESEFPNCPKCNSSMVLRNGRFGEFLSCSIYPECNGTRTL